MRFSKLHASGNDFVVLDNRDGKVYSFVNDLRLDMKDFVVKVCAFHTGVGADGLILIESPDDPKNHFKWQFFNSDGSVAEMCGNGSRCAVRFAYERGIAGQEVRFETLAGIIKAEVLEKGRRVKVLLTKPKDYRDVTLDVKGTRLEGSFINTGVPHFVVRVEEIDSLDVVSLGRAVRFHPAFEPKGTNVNFLQVVGENKIKVRTYERGVEGETLACGTGATACAIVSYLKGWVKGSPVDVFTKGGDLLRIHFLPDLQEVYLEGPVVWVFDGELREELFL
ncbi:diaminopimelate epimerase [Thermocrinis albus DSM 14484]|uniref:Diaminopimelate epimerase n=1 Tax=Thermocrinis albus (strain DSM 14484 / JCM 11386 / HI 11/12) TaxID=638303 RepID=D3SMD8_THEAH|nr:diaminopimelate epimerase [Thermocrinis albus]ADC89918.1 diaminopimelate epimerase [Thermocrinis albus DSM 14484]